MKRLEAPSYQKALISRFSDIARLLGASAIFYYHVGLVTGWPLSSWGEYAVALFITLAGLAYICFSRLTTIDPQSYGRYVGRRFMAIFPMFLVVNIVIFLASYLYPPASGKPFSVTEFVLSAAGVSQYFGFRYMSRPMWFVPLILQAYCVFPLVQIILDRFSSIVVMVAAFAVSLLLINLVFFLWPARGTDICRNWSVVFRLPELCFGVIIGRCVICSGKRVDGLIAAALFICLSLLLAALSGWGLPRQSYILALPWNGFLVSLIITIAAITGAVIIRSDSGGRLLRRVGAASFPFFLGHGVAILFVYRRFGNSLAVWAGYLVVCWIGATILSFALDHGRKIFSAAPAADRSRGSRRSRDQAGRN